VIDGTLDVTNTLHTDMGEPGIIGTGTVHAGHYEGVGKIFGVVANDLEDGKTYQQGSDGKAEEFNPLPIELTYFNVSSSTNGVLLTWQTASEENNDYFTIERSSDGVNFDVLKTINGAGNSTTMINYSTADNNPVSGISYYRLKQTDYNGDYSYSAIKSVAWNGNLSNKTIAVYPNPSLSTSTITIETNGFSSDEVSTIQIYALNGQLVFEQISSLSTGISISPNLLKGVYLVRVSSTAFTANSKLIVE